MTAVQAPQPGVSRPTTSHSSAHRCARPDVLPRGHQASNPPPRPRRSGPAAARRQIQALRRRCLPAGHSPARGLRGTGERHHPEPVRARPLRCREALARMTAADWPPQAEPQALL